MKKNNLVYLSYVLDENTPTYGNRNKFVCEKKSDMSKGDVANDTSIVTTVHVGTHIDMPYHFFNNGQTIKDFDVNYFRFNNVLFIEINPNGLIIKDELIHSLEQQQEKLLFDLLIVKTGICHIRGKDEFWESNYGFDPSIASYLRKHYPNVRVIGFDSLSVSSIQSRLLGRKSHQEFLNPKKPILLLEDMDLTTLNKNSIINRIDIAPLRISNCDGLPCTVIAEVI